MISSPPPSRDDGTHDEVCLTTRDNLEAGNTDAHPIDARLETHLLACESCAEFRDDLVHARSLAKRLPDIPFPNDALEEVWARTVDTLPAETPPHTAGIFAPHWLGRGLAAAALLLVCGIAVLTVWRGSNTERMTEAELARVDHEVREVLLLLSNTLRRAERIDEIMNGDEGHESQSD